MFSIKLGKYYKYSKPYKKMDEPMLFDKYVGNKYPRPNKYGDDIISLLQGNLASLKLKNDLDISKYIEQAIDLKINPIYIAELAMNFDSPMLFFKHFNLFRDHVIIDDIEQNIVDLVLTDKIKLGEGILEMLSFSSNFIIRQHLGMDIVRFRKEPTTKELLLVDYRTSKRYSINLLYKSSLELALKSNPEDIEIRYRNQIVKLLPFDDKFNICSSFKLSDTLLEIYKVEPSGNHYIDGNGRPYQLYVIKRIPMVTKHSIDTVIELNSRDKLVYLDMDLKSSSISPDLISIESSKQVFKPSIFKAESFDRSSNPVYNDEREVSSSQPIFKAPVYDYEKEVSSSRPVSKPSIFKASKPVFEGSSNPVYNDEREVSSKPSIFKSSIFKAPVSQDEREVSSKPTLLSIKPQAPANLNIFKIVSNPFASKPPFHPRKR